MISFQPPVTFHGGWSFARLAREAGVNEATFLLERKLATLARNAPFILQNEARAESRMPGK